MSRKLAVVATSAAIGLTLGTVAIANASPEKVNSQETGFIKILEIGTDQMGADTYHGRNYEFVTFVAKQDVDLTGYVIGDEWAKSHNYEGPCNTYRFTGTLPGKSDLKLAKDEKVTVFNGRGRSQRFENGPNPATYRLFANSRRTCGLNGHYFNNNKDTVFIKALNGDEAFFSWNWRNGYSVKAN